MKTVEKALVIGFLFTILFNITCFANKCDNLSTKVLRLHILANSDTSEDQELKIKVRDKIIEQTGNFLDQAKDITQAEEITLNSLERIKETAQEEIKKQGFDYPVHIELTDMYFPTRQYDNTILPAGHYNALRILIGEGKGHNWWCVIFPQMCLSSAQNTHEKESIFTHEETDIINSAEKYEIKFKVVEWFYSIKDCVTKWFK